jgi:plasmid stability protein
MAELHITDIDEQVLARLRERAKKENRSMEALIREGLERAAYSAPSDQMTTAEGAFVQAVKRIQAIPAEERVPDFKPVEIEGIPASELLIRDRRRR